MTPAFAIEAALACAFWFVVGIRVGRDVERRRRRRPRPGYVQGDGLVHEEIGRFHSPGCSCWECSARRRVGG